MLKIQDLDGKLLTQIAKMKPPFQFEPCTHQKQCRVEQLHVDVHLPQYWQQS